MQTAPILFLNSAVDRMHAGRDDLCRQLALRGIYSGSSHLSGGAGYFLFTASLVQPTRKYIIDFLSKVLNVKS